MSEDTMTKDTRPRATAPVDVDLAALAIEIGDDRLALAEDGRTVVAAADSGVTQAQLEAAVKAHTPPAPEPDPQDAFAAAVNAATTIADLKAALLGSGDRSAMAAAKGKPQP